MLHHVCDDSKKIWNLSVAREFGLYLLHGIREVWHVVSEDSIMRIFSFGACLFRSWYRQVEEFFVNPVVCDAHLRASSLQYGQTIRNHGILLF